MKAPPDSTHETGDALGPPGSLTPTGSPASVATTLQAVAKTAAKPTGVGGKEAKAPADERTGTIDAGSTRAEPTTIQPTQSPPAIATVLQEVARTAPAPRKELAAPSPAPMPQQAPTRVQPGAPGQADLIPPSRTVPVPTAPQAPTPAPAPSRPAFRSPPAFALGLMKPPVETEAAPSAARSAEVAAPAPRPAFPAGALMPAISQASGKARPPDIRAVGPQGGGSAAYAASVGIASPEQTQLGWGGNAEITGKQGSSVEGQRPPVFAGAERTPGSVTFDMLGRPIVTKGKPAKKAGGGIGGPNHPVRWAEAEVWRESAADSAWEALGRLDQAEEKWAKYVAWAEKIAETAAGVGDLTPQEREIVAKAKGIVEAAATEKALINLEIEGHVEAMAQAQSAADRAYDNMTPRERAQKDKEKARLKRREDRKEAAEKRAAQRRARKGNALWRHRAKRRLARRLRQLNRDEKKMRRQMTEHDSQKGVFHRNFESWKKANDKLESIEKKLGAVNDKLLDKNLTPKQRLALLKQREQLEQEKREQEATKQWEEHGGFDCYEIDCSKPEYKKCRPACADDETCKCKGDDAPRRPGPTTESGSGRQKDPEGKGRQQGVPRQPVGTSDSPQPGTDSGRPEQIDEVVDPAAVSPRVMEIYRKALRRGIDPLRVLNAAEIREIERRLARHRHEWEQRRRERRPSQGRLPVRPPGTTPTTTRPPQRRSTGFWLTDALDRLYSPFEAYAPAINRGYRSYDRGVKKANRMVAYGVEQVVEGLEGTTDQIAQALGILVRAEFERALGIYGLVAGRTRADNTRAALRLLLRRFEEMLEESEAYPLTGSSWEAWVVGKVRTAFDAAKDPEQTARDFALGFKEAVEQLPEVFEAAKRGDEQAQVALLLFALELTRGRGAKARRIDDLARRRRLRGEIDFTRARHLQNATKPSRWPNAKLKARGEPAPVRVRRKRGETDADYVRRRSPEEARYRSEKETADILARAGYDIEHTPQRRGAVPAKADYLIEGRPVEQKRWVSAKDEMSHVDSNLDDLGKDRYVVDLRGSPFTVEGYREAVMARAGAHVKEVTVIMSENRIVRIYP